jgi:hypothetical protein
LPSSTRPRKPRCVLAARSFRNSAFIVPLRPTRNSEISPSASVTMGTPANFRCLNNVATSAWSRLIRSSASANNVELSSLRAAKERLDGRPEDHARARYPRVRVGQSSISRVLPVRGRYAIDLRSTPRAGYPTSTGHKAQHKSSRVSLSFLAISGALHRSSSVGPVQETWL